jgi:hypothetical protein
LRPGLALVIAKWKIHDIPFSRLRPEEGGELYCDILFAALIDVAPGSNIADNFAAFRALRIFDNCLNRMRL